MKREQLDKLSKEAANKRAQSLNVPKPPLATETLSKAKSTHQLRVAVSRTGESDQDALATQGLIEAYHTKDGFKCPRCPYSTTNTDDFIQHIAGEINKSLDTLNR